MPSLTPQADSVRRQAGELHQAREMRWASVSAAPPTLAVGQAGFLDQILVQLRHRRRVEADDVRQQDADRQAVRDAVVGGQRVGAGVADAEHRVLDGGAGQEGAHLHGAAGFEIRRVVQHLFEIDLQQLPRLAREHLRHRVAPAS